MCSAAGGAAHPVRFAPQAFARPALPAYDLDAGGSTFLAARAPLDEVNFWQPSPRRPVHLDVGAPFLFKLHAPQGGSIVVGGYFAHFTTLPATTAWNVF
jgi:hypothetical protein